MRLRDWLLTAWFSPRQLVQPWKAYWSLAFLIAWPLSRITAWESRRRRRAIQHINRRADDPRPIVIVVGNLVVGGAGKTPIVIALVDALRQAGLETGVIARGYKAPTKRRAKASEAGDEAQLIAARCSVPVRTHPDRILALEALQAAHPSLQAIVSDDGLQHVGLPRDIEVIVIDPRGLGNGHLLPAGPLRESADRLLSADAIVFSKGAKASNLAYQLPASLPQFTSDIRIKGFRQLSHHDKLLSPAEFVMAIQNAPLAALAGIASPKTFFLQATDLLADHGVQLPELACLSLDDHATFDEAILIAHLQSHHARVLLMTEKDLVKCDPSWACADACWAMVIDATLPPELIQHILNTIYQLLGLPSHGPTTT